MKKEEDRDTPLSKSPEAISPVTDVKSALADIEARSAARQKSVLDSNAKLNEARVKRSREKTNQSEGKLYGLASFASTTGRETK